MSKKRNDGMNDDIKTFIANTEATVRRVLKDQTKKAEANSKRTLRNRPTALPNQISRDTLNAAYTGSALIIPGDYESTELPRLNSTADKNSTKKTKHTKSAMQLPTLKSPMQKAKQMEQKLKLLNSPLYAGMGKSKSMTASQFKKNMAETTAWSQLLSTSGVPNSSFRPGHAVDRRMCNACWMENTDTSSSCSHGGTLNIKKKPLGIELQGPTSWTTIDLRTKYRNEMERENVFAKAKRIQDEALELEQETGIPQVAPIVERHPMYSALFNMIAGEGRIALSDAHGRNARKAYVFNVHRVWMTNLDHVNHDQDTTQNAEDSLTNRLDMKLIQRGHSQIPSVSINRALCNALDEKDIKSYKLDFNDAPLISNTTAPTTTKFMREDFIPLSIEICGRKDLLGQVPGTTSIGQKGLWWTAPQDAKYTQSAAMFLRDSVLSSSNNVLVLLVFALDSPFTTLSSTAWLATSLQPPPIIVIQFDGGCIVACTALKTSILLASTQKIVDAELPPTLALLNSFEEEEDYLNLAGTEVKGHRRGLNERNKRYFMQQTSVQLTEPNFSFECTAFGVTADATTTNKTGTHGRYTWHSVQKCTEELCRRRTARDYLGIVSCLLSRGCNDPSFFLVRMLHEKIGSIATSGLSIYLKNEERKRQNEERKRELQEIEAKIENGKLALEAKRAEQIRIEREQIAIEAQKDTKLEGNKKPSPQALEEWEDRVQNSYVLREWNHWQERKETRSDAIFYHCTIDSIQNKDQWHPPADWNYEENPDLAFDRPGTTAQSAPGSASTYASTPYSQQSRLQTINIQVDALAKKLTDDEHFLAVLRAKLGLPDAEVAVEQLNDEESECDSSVASESDEDEDENELHELRLREKKLKFPSLNVGHGGVITDKGAGWQKLKSSAIPKGFAQKVYLTVTEGPMVEFVNKLNTPQIAGMLDPAVSVKYQAPEFIPALNAQFIADVTAETERMTRNVSTAGSNQVYERRFEEFEAESKAETNALENAAAAIICARNDNMSGLEKLLDDSVDVDTRDPNGNTLFIIACQQGYKRIAKLLLRKGAVMNAQNFSGNTGLHYCYEYQNDQIADYLLKKGADDSIVNAEGLTCYEGISQENLGNL